MSWFNVKGRKFILAVYLTIPEIIFLGIRDYQAAEIWGAFALGVAGIYGGFNVGASIAAVLKGRIKWKIFF